MSGPPPNRRHRLRIETRTAHDRVDRLGGGFDLGAAHDLRAFLSAHWAALAPLEAGLDAWGAQGLLPDWSARRRTPALAADLRGLGVTPETVEPAIVGDAATAWGLLYVLEGSRLGGQVLVRAVRASTDPVVRTAVAYLGHGAEGRFWPAFVSALDAASLPPDAWPQLLAGAHGAFARFEAALARSAASSG